MTDQASSTPQPAKGDERNIVAVAPTAPQATLEERLAKIWKDNRTVLLVGVALVIGIIIGRAVWEGQVARRDLAVQAAFGAAETPEAKLAFAREHAGSALAGVALIGAADDAYEKADYTTAAARYAQAGAKLTEPHLKSRARLGEAVSSLQAGLASKGESLLREIGNDAAAPEGIRAEAWYHLAAYSLDAGNHAAARDAVSKVGEVSPRSMWTMRATALSAKLSPDAETTPATP